MRAINKKIKTSFWIVCFLLVLNCCFPGRQAHAEKNQYRAISTSFWIGYYRPKDPTFSLVYPKEKEVCGFVEFSKIWAKRMEVTLGLGGSYFTGHPLNDDGSSNIDKASLTLAPSYLQLSYFLRYSQEQRIVPYLGAGFDAWGYREKTETDTLEGCKYGYHYLVGLRFLLDWLDPKSAAYSYRDFGIENTYLVLEARTNSIDNFGGNKLDLSGPIYRLGFLMEF